MLAGWNFAEIANALAPRARAATVIEAIPELMPEPTLACRTTPIAPKRRRFLEPAPRQPSAKEHAEKLLEWICTNVDLSDGPITHAAMLEFYTEMLIAQGWTAGPWNPVAYQFRILTTGNRKTYAWITTTTGALHRLRIYPIPERAVEVAPTPGPQTAKIGSRIAPKFRRPA